MSDESIVQVTTSKDELAILGASDDRELLSQGLDDFLPYDLPFEALVEIKTIEAKRNYDNRGVFVQLRVLESSAPREVQVNKTYALAFFDTHKTLPPFVLSKMLQSRREFAAAVASVPCGDDFKAAPVLLQLAKASKVEPLGIKMRFKNEHERTTRVGKNIYKLRYVLEQ